MQTVSGNFMTDLEARHIARQYASEMGEVLPGFKLGIGEEEDFTDKFYFDFIWLTLDGQQPKEPPVAGGARGLTVDKHDKRPEITTHGSYSALKRQENELEASYQLLLAFKNGKKHSAEVKAKLNLNSEQLLELSKTIKETELSKFKTYEIMNRLLEKIKNCR
jgi:hypothetical protein